MLSGVRVRSFGAIWDQGSEFWCCLGSGFKVSVLCSVRVRGFGAMCGQGSKFLCYLWSGFEVFAARHNFDGCGKPAQPLEYASLGETILIFLEIRFGEVFKIDRFAVKTVIKTLHF